MSQLTLAERVELNIQRTDACWTWIGGRRGRGYGRIKVNGRAEPAHRVVWTLVNGAIPDGMFVLHHCDNPSCVRPDHLFLGTLSDNTRDAVQKGRQRNIRKTTCDDGHPFNAQNTRIGKNGWRWCRICDARRAREYRMRQRTIDPGVSDAHDG